MKKAKVAIVFVGVLVLLALANYAFNMDPTQLAARGVGKDAHDHGNNDEHVEEAVVEIAPLGPTGAPVTIEVFYAGEAVCREAFWPIMSEINATYGDKVRVDFSDLTDVEVNKRAREMTLKGTPGLTVNGETIVNVPGAGAFDAVVFSGSPQDRSWTPPMLHQAIQSELTARGIEFEPPAPQIPPQPDEHAGHDH
jgi:hypothetical protein